MPSSDRCLLLRPNTNFSASSEEASVMQDLHTDIQDVKSELKRLPTNKAAGPVGVPSIILKQCADALAWPLTMLSKSLLTLGTYRKLQLFLCSRKEGQRRLH